MELRKDWLVCLSFTDEDGNLLYQMDSCFIPNIGEAVYFSSAKTRYIIKNRVVEINNQMMYVTLFLSHLTPRAADLPTVCPNGHGPLIIDGDLRFCDICKFTASR